ncbi:hypothetical protein [Sphingobacterium anhuiense]|uniref:hypothetical protein n=1 Tax=Sphingobacterium anhuiense TaxID=493780 RepID=UPI003C2F37F1
MRELNLLIEVIQAFENKANEMIKILAHEFNLDLKSDQSFQKLINRDKNLVLMGTETINGGTLPTANVPPPPGNYNPPVIWIPPTNPSGPPSGPPPGPTSPPSSGTGGGGGTNTSGSQKLTKVGDPDPCKGKTAVDKRLNNEKILAQAKEALSKTRKTPVGGKTVEYGFETVLTNLTTFDFKNNATKNGSESNVNLNTRWNATDGYTVGYTHSHPKNGAPSPSDLFIGADTYRDWASYNLPTAQKNIYADYYTSTIVTDNQIYVVTIKDPVKWGNGLDLSNQQARDDAKIKYRDLANEYMRNTQLYDDTVNGQLYALLNMYGDAVNIYRAPNSSGPLNFVPLQLALGGVVTKRC